MKAKILLLISLLLLSSCASKPMEEKEQMLLKKNKTESYDLLYPFAMSETREYHAQYAHSSEDFNNIGNRLLEISKEYFSPSEYFLAEGSIITHSRLMKLVGRESDKQEMGLNPRRDEPLDIGVPGIELTNAVIVSDVIEQDYYKVVEGENKLSGVSLCIVMNAKQTIKKNERTTTYTLKDDVLFEYGSTMARKLERYMRTLGESRSVPILITLYVNGANDEYVPGYMLGKAYFKDRTPNFKRIDEKWVLYPSKEASKLDSFNTAQFQTFKSALSEFIFDDVGIVGLGFYEENNLQKLNITIQYTHKTYVELVGIIRYCSILLENFSNDQFDIQVHFKNQSSTQAVVLKYAGSKESIVVSMN